MFFKSIKFWLLFCVGTEMGIDLVAQSCNCNLSMVVIVKLLFYVICYILLNFSLNSKKINENATLGINCGVSTVLSSLMGAVSLTIILKSENNISWILFLLAYIGILVLCFIIWKRSDVSREGKEKEKSGYNTAAIKAIGGSVSLVSICFVRTASDDMQKIGYMILYLITLWVLLFFGLLFFVKYKKELKSIFTLKNKDCN